MKIFGNRDLKLFMALLAVAMLVIWMIPISMIFAQGDEEEKILEELTGEEEVTEEGSIEVLGFTEEDSTLLNNRFLIAVIILVVAAVGGLFLSFVIRGRT